MVKGKRGYGQVGVSKKKQAIVAEIASRVTGENKTTVGDQNVKEFCQSVKKQVFHPSGERKTDERHKQLYATENQLLGSDKISVYSLRFFHLVA